jgi:hypothetical protein
MVSLVLAPLGTLMPDSISGYLMTSFVVTLGYLLSLAVILHLAARFEWKLDPNVEYPT